jgi:hypothetical protein
MPDNPYFCILETTLAGNASGTLSYQVPANMELTIRGWRQVSTGAFNLTGVRDSQGLYYTNASASVEIPSSYIADLADGNNGLKDFPMSLVIEGGTIIYIDVEDTSGAGNTVTIVLDGIMTRP